MTCFRVSRDSTVLLHMNLYNDNFQDPTVFFRFLWFAKDFESYGGVTKFISPFLPPSESQYIAQKNPSIKYFNYNWDANGTPPCNC